VKPLIDYSALRPAPLGLRARLAGIMVLAALSVALIFGSALAGCPALPAPDGCTPSATRCHVGMPEVCSQTQRWSQADRLCTDVGAVCCATRSHYRETVLHACVPQDQCVPEPAPADAGPDAPDAQ
jgi:hypothetical protein